MSFRRHLLGTLVIQGVGAASIFAAIITIGLVSGPEVQGLFSRIKSEIELITVFSLFGMPQAVFFFLNAKRMDVGSAIKVGVILSVLSIFISLAYLGSTDSTNYIGLIFFAFASAVIVFHGVLRVIILACSTSYLFNLVTAVPQFVLFLLAMVSLLVGHLTATFFYAIFFVSFAVSCVLAYVMQRTLVSAASISGVRRVGLSELLSFGVLSWVTGVLSTFSVVFCLRYIEGANGPATVGVFTMGLVFVQILLTPFNYVSPLLFKRWMESPAPSKLRPIAFWSAAGCFSIVVMVLMVLDSLSLPGPISAYAVLLAVKWPLGILVAAETVIRISGVAANAAGHPWIPALAEALRLALIAIGVALGFGNGLESIVFLWMSGAVLASVALMAVEHYIAAQKRVLL